MEYINRFYWLIALCLIISTGANASVNPKPFVIPELKEWKGSDGVFVPTEATKIVYAANNPELERIARIFAQDYQTMFGRSLEVVQGKGAAGDFIFSLRTDKKLGKEGYTIRVTDRVALSAPENIGVYWGTRTLLQIAEQSENHQLPKGTLRDYPDYPLRGFMIDCGRKFIPLSYLQDYVKTMSYYKMNTLQIHLNDNGFKQYFEHDWSKTYAAFRLECDTYPGLTARDASVAGFNPYEQPTVRDLLYGVLLPSGADACETLARAVGGSEEGFVAMMNQKAEELGLTNTHFENCTGLHNDNHYSTCRDIAVLMSECLKSDTFREIVTREVYTTEATASHPEGITLYDTMLHRFTSYEMSTTLENGAVIEGGKTGFTDEAGQCLVSFAEYGGEEYILVTAEAMTDSGSAVDSIADASTVYGRLQ